MIEKYNPSILQNEQECYISGKTNCDLVRHEIYFGKNRQASKKNGFWVYLTPEWHNLSKYSVHLNKQTDFKLKQDCQMKFEETHSREEFLKLIGKNYLEEKNGN